MSPNPTHLKSRFAHRFVRALNNLNNTKRSSNDKKLARKSRRVKIAAYTAMASIVGSKRAWSRAVIWKIRNRSRNKGLLVRKRIKVVHKFSTNSYHHYAKRRNLISKREDFDMFKNSGQELKLRKLIPGGETMNSWCLMGETADYIKCLVAQNPTEILYFDGKDVYGAEVVWDWDGNILSSASQTVIMDSICKTRK